LPFELGRCTSRCCGTCGDNDPAHRWLRGLIERAEADEPATVAG
jgi:hypothetical protein